jgi:hypothetical protein
MKPNLRRAPWGWVVGLTVLGQLACAGGGVYGAYVIEQPPPERIEVVEASPGPAYVWVPGYWTWTGAEYSWSSGRWVVPPRGHNHWVRGRWERRGHHWRRVDGHWR